MGTSKYHGQRHKAEFGLHSHVQLLPRHLRMSCDCLIINMHRSTGDACAISFVVLSCNDGTDRTQVRCNSPFWFRCAVCSNAISIECCWNPLMSILSQQRNNIDWKINPQLRVNPAISSSLSFTIDEDVETYKRSLAWDKSWRWVVVPICSMTVPESRHETFP